MQHRHSLLKKLTSTFVLLALAMAAAHAADVVRGPYLQSVASTGLSIKWRTDVATDATVRYGSSPGNLNNVVNAGGMGPDHEVVLVGLAPATRYYYSVGDSSGTIAGGDSTYTFKTAPDSSSAPATRIWVIGDSGMANLDAANVRDAFVNYTGSRGADLWLMLGDNAYDDGTDAEYQSAVFDTYPVQLRQIPLWPTFGNHDGHSADSGTQTGPYYDIFSLPVNGESGGSPSGTEAYYSFDYGNIHFISLDSYDSSRSTNGAMLTWLSNDLAGTTKDWVIAYWHHPPYTKGSHDSDYQPDSDGVMFDMRSNALPILESYGVDLVLNGHSHSYERSYLLDGHYGTSGSFNSSMRVDSGDGRENGDGAYSKNPAGAANQGAVYAVVGSSAKLGGGSLDHPAMYIGRNILGSMVLDIDGDRLDARFLDDSGAVIDNFSITKGAVVPPNSAPYFTSTAVASAREGVSYAYDIVAVDPDAGDTVAISAMVLPGWMRFTDNGNGTATLRGTATAADVGQHRVELRVRENAPAPGLSGNQQFDVTVTPVPVIDNPPPKKISGGGSLGGVFILFLLALCWGAHVRRH